MLVNDNGNTTSVVSGFLWRFLERCGAQGVSFIVTIVLARLLAPEVYGEIALVTVFISIMQVFIDSGFGTALIQKKDADDLDFSTVFYFNLAVCLLLYTLMFFAAPLIANFYHKPALTSIVRVLSLTLLVSGVKNVQQAYVSRNMLFKRFFWATLGGTVSAAVLGIWMAYMGYGIWALIAQYLCNAIIDTMILWITVRWRPKCMFSMKRLKALFSFGWKMLASGLLDTVCRDLRQLIIGKLYATADLAFYNKGNQFPQIIVSNINSGIDSVLLPTMAREQENRQRIKDMTRRAIKVSTYLIAPMMIGLAAASDKVVVVLLTDKWNECVPYLCVFCIVSMFYPIHTANLNALKAMGRSDYFLKLEILKKVVELLVLVATMWISPFAMCLSALVVSFLGQVINAYPNKKLLKYTIVEQWKDIFPSITLAVFMGGCVLLIGYILPFSSIVTLIIQVFVGMVTYIALSALFKIDSFIYCLNKAKEFTGKNKAIPQNGDKKSL